MESRNKVRMTYALHLDKRDDWEEKDVQGIPYILGLMRRRVLEIVKGHKFVAYTIYFYGSDGRLYSIISSAEMTGKARKALSNQHVEVVIGRGLSGVVMEKEGAGGSGRGLVMGVEESIVVKHVREEVSKGHVGFVGEGGCKVFVAYSFDAGDERAVGNDGVGEVVSEGADVLDEAVRGTGLAEVAKLFKVVVNGFLGAEGGSEEDGPLEEGVAWSSGGSAVASFSHPPFGCIAEEAGGGNGEPVGKGHVVELKRVLKLG
ncbi:hypothetical protein CBR_g27906 [Chara braunii]|uniref:Uncharacterized protein n=1 Tax=Chara braunii TaxID=69332 RepID=A0A388L8W1_CHABU|nr:hypothetical protein CBR_g27906 [Chara braunii]|eukprot:GBG78682.1 hypothetical protein CBR_g27906 [Chara braunii]